MRHFYEKYFSNFVFLNITCKQRYIVATDDTKTIRLIIANPKLTLMLWRNKSMLWMLISVVTIKNIINTSLNIAFKNFAFITSHSVSILYCFIQYSSIKILKRKKDKKRTDTVKYQFFSFWLLFLINLKYFSK